MTVVDDGKNRLRDLLEADIDNITLGTDSTSPTVSDSALGSETAVTSATPTTTTGNKIVNVTHVLDSTTGTGTSYYEAAIFVNSGSTLYDRIVFPEYAHTTNDELHTTFVERIE